jgi:hypothetical protein
MNKSIFLIIGSPGSGLNLISGCLDLLNVKRPEHQTDEDTINRLFLQELDLSCGILVVEKKLLQSEAARIAKKRIRTLISSKTTDPAQLRIGNPLLVDLWHTALIESDIIPHDIFLIRHPYEISLSFQKNKGIDLVNGCLLWLSHIRTAMRNMYKHKQTIVFFDQLLADPISTLGSLLGSKDVTAGKVAKDFYSVLKFVQPSLKNKHSSDFSESDIEMYQPFAKIFNQLKSYRPGVIKTEHQELKHILFSRDVDIIDSLFKTFSDKTRQFNNKLSKKHFERIDEKIDKINKEIISVKNALNKERSDRISSFAYRDSRGTIPRKFLILLTLHRCGSTYLMDALRTHPDIYIEPRAFLQEYLNLLPGRYPVDLAGKGSGPFLDIEQRPGQGTHVPVLGSHQKPGLLSLQLSEDSVAIEKIHSEFYRFNTKRFLSDIAQLNVEKKVVFKFVYQIRDPKSVISSFLKYKKRNPAWYRHIKEDDIPRFIYREFFYLKDFQKKYGQGIIVDYEDLILNFEKTLTAIFEFLWPEKSHPSQGYNEIVQRARQFTDRNKRMAQQATPFLGNQMGNVRGGDMGLQEFFEKHRSKIEKSYKIYNELYENRKK